MFLGSGLVSNKKGIKYKKGPLNSQCPYKGNRHNEIIGSNKLVTYMSLCICIQLRLKHWIH